MASIKKRGKGYEVRIWDKANNSWLNYKYYPDDDLSPNSNYIGGNVKPDIILFNPQTNKYVVFDVKYKNLLYGKTARDDRLQVLAYALLYNCENVGIIFPTLDGTENVYYERNEIESVEQRQRYYNQLEIAIDTKLGICS